MGVLMILTDSVYQVNAALLLTTIVCYYSYHCQLCFVITLKRICIRTTVNTLFNVLYFNSEMIQLLENFIIFNCIL